MITLRLLRFVPASALTIALGASAQFYAPDTEFHDKAQRMFPVEAARVLAWRANQDGQKVWELTYSVKTGTNQFTSWDINWLGKDGKTNNHFQIEYPDSWLTSGPQFYRNVFKDVWVAAKRPGAGNHGQLAASELNARFWQGAELTGMAREEGLRAAFTLAKTNLEVSRDGAVLAGVLTHIPLPSLSGGMTLDAMLLARGAAWLALSETTLKNPGEAADENWAPLIFMAGRENAACDLWKTKVAAGQDMSHRPTLYEWWDFFLRRPKARAAFEFAAGSRQRRFGMPLLTYYSRVQHLGTPLANVLIPLYGPTAQSLQRLYGYGVFLEDATSVGGARILEGAWPAFFRAEWLKLMKDYKVAPQDYEGYVATLRKTEFNPGELDSQPDDYSLAGLKECAPLFELGYEQGKGPLTPVATATARDLLNYGWEMNAMQMGARYWFVNNDWGVRDLGQKIFEQSMHDIQGQSPFFRGAYQQTIFNLQESVYRLQLVDDLAWRVQADVHPYSKDITDAAGARMYYHRCWLRPYEVRMQAYVLCRSGQCDEGVQMLQRYHAECGRKSDELTMEYVADWESKDLAEHPALKKLGEQLAEEVPEPTQTSIKLLYQKKYQALLNDQRAEAYEKLFWQNPDCNLEQDIFNGYIIGGAWKSAKRFYKQAREVLSRDVSFSNWLAPKAWMLGFLDNDEELMNMAVEDSRTGSYIAMLTTIWHFAAHDQPKEMEEQITELIERYEKNSPANSQGRMMKGLMPLMPALKDPKAADHEAALEHFGKSDAAVNLRWILIQKYKLSNPDAIRFLGGRETDRYRRVMILYLEKQKDQIKQAALDYVENTRNTGAGRVVASWVLSKLFNSPSHIEEKDLRPANAKSIEQAVLSKVGLAR